MKTLLFTALCAGYCIKRYLDISALEKEYRAFEKEADKEIAAIAARTMKELEASQERMAAYKEILERLHAVETASSKHPKPPLA